MIMKLNIKLLVLITVLMSTTLTWADSTVDKLVLSDVTLSPGGDEETQYATLSVVSAVRKYAAFNVDIYLPEGVAPAYYEGELDVYEVEGGILPKSSRKYKHNLDVSYTESENRLRLICYASPSTDFTSEAGSLYYIGLTASTYAKPGKASVELKKQNLTTADETKYEPADASYDITIGTSAKADLSVSSANKWSTVILPFATELPAGLKAYTCNSKNDEEKVFYLTGATQIDAYTPYILYSESGYTGTLTGEVDASQYPEAGYVTKGYLTGAVKSQTTNEGYILQNKGEGVKFYLANPELSYTIPAGKCWATPTDAEQDSYDFSFAPTAVNSVVETVESKNENKFDINGVMINSPQKGQLYIQSRKKLLR